MGKHFCLVDLRSRKLLSVLAVGIVLGLSACSGPGSPVTGKVSAAGELASKTVEGAVSSKASPPPPAVYRPTRAQAATSSSGSESSASTEGETGGKLRPLDFPYENTVPVKSSATPLCVSHGDKIDLSVTVPPEAAVAYQAIYSDGRSGSEPPFGQGYGGNDKGYGSKSGHYSSSFVVGPTAPIGRARLDVFVGFEGEWGYDFVRFAVADEKGNCPQRWIRGKG